MNKELDEFLSSDTEYTQYNFGRLWQQEEFLTSPIRYKMLSGGFGTGKTSILCGTIIWLLTQIPKNLGYLGRLDGKALRQSTMVALESMLHKSMYTRNDQQGRLTFKREYGGSTLIYGDFKDLNDLKNHPLGFFAVEQAEEIEEPIWDYLSGRLRRRIPMLSEEGKKQFRVITGKSCPNIVVEELDKRHFAYEGDTVCRYCGGNLPPYSVMLPKNAKELKEEERKPPWDLIIYPRFGIGVCNPEGTEHWIYKMFPGLPDRDGNLSEGTDNPKLKGKVQAWHCDTYDGLMAGFIDQEYVSDLEAKYQSNQAMFDRYLISAELRPELCRYLSHTPIRHPYSPKTFSYLSILTMESHPPQP